MQLCGTDLENQVSKVLTVHAFPALRHVVLLSLLSLPTSGCHHVSSYASVPPTTSPGHTASAPSALPNASKGIRVISLNFETLEKSEASGFFIETGIFVTCNHAVSDETPLGLVLPDGERLTIGDVIASDREADLALLQIHGDQPHLKLSDTMPPVGSQLLTLSKFGTLSATLKELDDVEMVLTAPGLRKGASGGAVLDQNGRVVGIIRGAVDNDAKQVVAVRVGQLKALIVEHDSHNREPMNVLLEARERSK